MIQSITLLTEEYGARRSDFNGHSYNKEDNGEQCA